MNVVAGQYRFLSPRRRHPAAQINRKEQAMHHLRCHCALRLLLSLIFPIIGGQWVNRFFQQKGRKGTPLACGWDG
ncbi:MAG: hypothetical protein ACRCWR_00925 [Saezia sp.]